MGSKKAIFFVPNYLGSLRYFERLIPDLQKKYDVYFLILFTRKEFYKEMITYCDQKEIRYVLVNAPKIPRILKRIPWVEFCADILSFKKGIDKTLSDFDIRKIISSHEGSIFMGYMFDRAKLIGIKCDVLQWALAYEGQKERPKIVKSQIKHSLYRFKKRVKILFRKFLLKLFFGFDFTSQKSTIGKGQSTRFAVINKQAYDYFIKKGVPANKMGVVGSLDFELSEKVKQKFENDQVKFDTAKKWGIDLSKKNIMVISSPLNRKDIVILDDKGQYEYAERIVKLFQEILPKSEYDILFKIHPAENLSLYEPLKNFGVKLFDKTAKNEELIYFSDLYIADNTNVNFTAIALEKKCIFINLFNLPVVEKSKDYFGILKFEHSWAEFEDSIRDYKNGVLEKRYKFNDEIYTKNSRKKILDWIN